MTNLGFGGRDSPDYGVGLVFSGMSINIDNAELVARLNCPHVINRTGNVLYLTSFEFGLGDWRTNAVGSNSSVDLWSQHYHHKPYSVRLYAGSELNSYAVIQRDLNYPYYSTSGFQFGFKLGSNVSKIIVTLFFRDGEYLYGNSMTIDVVNTQLYLTTGNAGTVVLDSNLVLTQNTEGFNVCKLVVDTSQWMFTRLLVNNAVYDLTSYTISKGAATTKELTSVSIAMYNESTFNADCYIDDFIYTINEPS